MHRLTILAIDDEPQIRRVVRNALAGDALGAGTTARVIEAGTGAHGLDLAAAEQPALIVLDLALPDMSGLDVCRDIRSWSAVPILVLSARHDDVEKATLLDAGADDYVTKPFSPVELQARARALVRRASRADGSASNAPLHVGDLTVDIASRTLRVRGAEVRLTPIEWELLRTLATQPGRTLTHRQLFSAVWPGRAYGDAQQYLRVHIAHLRRKIEDDPVRPRYIRTEPGVGYRFVGA